MPPCRETLWKAVDGWIPSVTLCSGRRIHHQQPIVAWETVPVFQPALSLWKATAAAVKRGDTSWNFNPRSPCGERPDYGETKLRTIGFQSTLSLRRATKALLRGLPVSPISIHALLAESDQLFGAVCEPNSDFNPRSPCGERRLGRCHSGDRHRISIHALLAESDVMFSFFPVKVCRFQSTLSLRRATIFSDPGHWTELFQSTLSLRRATPDRYSLRCVCLYFNPRSPCGERQANGVASLDDSGFQSTLSLRRATESIPFRFIFIGFQSTLSLRRAT